MARYSKQKSRMNRDEHPAFVPMLKTLNFLFKFHCSLMW